MAEVLVIDDNVRFRQVVARVLTGAGHRVQQAENGAEGLEIFRSRRPLLVITDLVMPTQEGIETIRELRQENPSVAIIAMSGYSSGAYLHAATTLGATASLTKPFGPDELLRLVAQLLAPTCEAPN